MRISPDLRLILQRNTLFLIITASLKSVAADIHKKKHKQCTKPIFSHLFDTDYDDLECALEAITCFVTIQTTSRLDPDKCAENTSIRPTGYSLNCMSETVRIQNVLSKAKACCSLSTRH